MQYAESYLSICIPDWLGYSDITFSVGDPEDAIFVVLDCNLACFISRVEVPEETDESPTTTVLITPLVPIPAEGLKSNFIFEPSRYAV